MFHFKYYPPITNKVWYCRRESWFSTCISSSEAEPARK